ncbi:unnamed protein product [Rotaria sp. Silwood2]|nr:unnamed protein product [Rotaria sp. Silwood2]
MSNNQDSTSSLRLSAPTSSLSISKNQVSFVTSENDRNHSIDQSFANESTRQNASYHHKPSVTKVPRNKVSAMCNTAQLNDSQRKYRSNTINTAISTIGNVNIEDANTAVYYNEPMHAIKLNENETSAIENSQIMKVNPSATAKQRGIRLIKASIGSQPITREHSSKTTSVTVTRVKSFSNNNKPRESNRITIFADDDGKHPNNKMNATSVPHQKPKNQSHK